MCFYISMAVAASEVIAYGVLRVVAADYRAEYFAWAARQPTLNFRGLRDNEERIFRSEQETVRLGASYGFTTRISLLGNFRGKFIQTDERGFRSVPDAGNPESPLVAFFGGSVVWGLSAETNGTTLPAHFQALSGGKFRAANYGVWGYSTVDSLANFLSAIIRDHSRDPFHAAVMVGAWNDCGRILFFLPDGKRPPPYTSDGIPVSELMPLGLFQSELEKNGKLIIDFNLAMTRFWKWATDLMAKLRTVVWSAFWLILNLIPGAENIRRIPLPGKRRKTCRAKWRSVMPLSRS